MTSVLYYQRMGFARGRGELFGPDGLVNAKRGRKVHPGRDAGSLDISRVSLGGPVFDVEKLRWRNGLWIVNLSADELIRRLRDWALNREMLERILPTRRVVSRCYLI